MLPFFAVIFVHRPEPSRPRFSYIPFSAPVAMPLLRTNGKSSVKEAWSAS